MRTIRDQGTMDNIIHLEVGSALLCDKVLVRLEEGLDELLDGGIREDGRDSGRHLGLRNL